MWMFYSLDDQGNPVEVDHETWSTSHWQQDNTLARDIVGQILISTVFLGLNHDYGEEGPPILWETMAFAVDGDIIGEYQERYSSREAALAGHRRAVLLATAKAITKET